jgi:hypothetical protein
VREGLAIGDSNVEWSDWPELSGLENAGIAGSQTSDWTPGGPNFPCYVDGRPVFVLLGTNDAIWLRPVSEYRDNLQSIVEELLLDGAESVTLITQPPVYAVGPEHSLHERLEEYREVNTTLCEAAGVWCDVDLSEMEETLFESDGLHFNDAGADFVAMAVPEPSFNALIFLGVAVVAALYKWRKNADRK